MKPDKLYRLLGVRLEGKGPFIREEKLGSQIRVNKLQRVQSGDFIYSRLFAWRGAFGLIPSNMDGTYVSNEFPNFKIDEKIIYPKFLNLHFRQRRVWKEVEKKCTGTTKASRNRFKEKFFLDFDISLPHLNEQKRIVAKIESLMIGIEKAKRLKAETINETNKLIASEIKHILDPHLSSIEKKEFKDETKWANLKLPDFVSKDKYAIKRGPLGSSLRKEFFVPLGFKIYEQKNVIKNDFAIGDYYIDKHRFEKLKAFKIQKDDVLITCSGTIGRVAIVPEGAEKGIINQALLKITLNKFVMDTEFFKILFESYLLKEELAKLSPGSAMKNITSVKKLKQIYFPVPSLQIQKRIVVYLESLRAKVDKLKNVRINMEEELEILSLSILDKAFKGEL